MALLMRFLYSFILILLSPVLLIYTLIQSYRRKGDLRFVAQRMGIYAEFPKQKQEPAIWFHAASVGETKAVTPLVLELMKHVKGYRIVISTNTSEAASLIKKTLPDTIKHYYFTTDFPVAVQRLVNIIQPRILFVVETEIWPNLYTCCYRRKIPIAILNARLSEKSMVNNRFIRALYREVLAYVELFMARNDENGQRYIALGAPADRVTTFGNIKLAAAQSERQAPHSVILDKRYVLAVSTHEGEELALAKIQRSLPKKYLFVIVPRHPQRRSAIVKSLQSLGCKVAVRSDKISIAVDTDIYLVDTLGEVDGFLSNALVVFVGGSLVPVGGHNVLEPAIYGKPILCGPFIESIHSEVKLLKDNDALTLVNDDQELEFALRKLLVNPKRIDKMGKNSTRTIAECETLLKKYCDQCLTMIES